MGELAFVLAGTMIGASVAVPVGPMGVLCISRTLAGGMRMGLSTGAGASTVQAAYCGMLLIGLQGAWPWFDGRQHLLGAAGGLLMFLFAWRVLRHQPVSPAQVSLPPLPLLAAYASAVAFGLSNPMVIVLLAASLTMFIGPEVPEGTDVAWLMAGVFAGSSAWWLCLSGATALLRSRLDVRALRLVNLAAAAVLAGSGLVMLARAASA